MVLLLQLGCLGLWKPRETSLGCLLTKQTFPCLLFSARCKNHIVQTCNELGAPRTAVLPHPCTMVGKFSFSLDLHLLGDVSFWKEHLELYDHSEI